MNRKLCRSTFILVFALWAGSSAVAQTSRPGQLADGLRPFLRMLSGEAKPFGISASVNVRVDRTNVSVDLRLVRFDDNAFDLDLTHADYSVRIRRRMEATAFALPHHKVAFIGHGRTDETDQLAPAKIGERIISPASMASVYSTLLSQGNPDVIAAALTQLMKIQFDPAANRWTAGKNVAFRFGTDEPSIDLTIDQTTVHVKTANVDSPAAVNDWAGFTTVNLDRAELERQLVRGVRRATEVLAPAPVLTSPAQTAKKVEHGEVRWVDGHRVVLLSGTPEQIGKAHGELLGTEAQRCVDSVLYSFGTAQTIRTGRWFRHDLEQAYARLAPHIPERHKVETRAMAASLHLDPKLVEALNVFPEMFHCSGFAVFGSATKDGKLYHGRVLDYMTTIGLQDAATTFIVAPEGHISFANVGYAGFIGSVSGMNSHAISLGEMGGRGEGQWDGVPMATLMRRALEECSTLDEVMDLWKKSPRTCEYYYVFADGNTNRAVGVAAVPEKVEFVLPGQSDTRLGEGIKDAVVLSAGSRLQELRSRVIKRHGEIDAEIGQWLMSRPVAMQSNLHNVLFVPADGVLYVANADHKHPAAERPYVRIDLNELLKSMTDKPVASATGTTGN
jgi:Acyl-coenzyme A:6-aminopenicillanic acid acyl-transferase